MKFHISATRQRQCQYMHPPEGRALVLTALAPGRIDRMYPSLRLLSSITSKVIYYQTALYTNCFLYEYTDVTVAQCHLLLLELPDLTNIHEFIAMSTEKPPDNLLILLRSILSRETKLVKVVRILHNEQRWSGWPHLGADIFSRQSHYFRRPRAVPH